MSIWDCCRYVNSSLLHAWCKYAETADACFSIYEKLPFVCLLYGLTRLHHGQSLTNTVLFWEFLFVHRRSAKAFVFVRDSPLLLHMKYLFRGVCLRLWKLSIAAQCSLSKEILLLSAAEGTCPGRTKEHLLSHSNDDIEWQYFLHNLKNYGADDVEVVESVNYNYNFCVGKLDSVLICQLNSGYSHFAHYCT